MRDHADHVRLDLDLADKPLVCDHCHARRRLSPSTDYRVAAVELQSFLDEHRSCVPSRRRRARVLPLLVGGAA